MDDTTRLVQELYAARLTPRGISGILRQRGISFALDDICQICAETPRPINPTFIPGRAPRKISPQIAEGILYLHGLGLTPRLICRNMGFGMGYVRATLGPEACR